MTITFTHAGIAAAALVIAGMTNAPTIAHAQATTQTNEPAAVQTDQTEAAKPSDEKQALSKNEIIAKLKEQGYPEVIKIKREKDKYWVKAKNTEGKKFELHVNAKTGLVTRKEAENE
jgi:uncharacterized membrane protein YkoI